MAFAQSTWVCGSLVQALSEKLGAPVIVWDNKGSEWTRLVVAGKFSSGFACCAKEAQPLILILSNKHYEALLPPSCELIPKGWLRETHDTIIDLLGAGRKQSLMSEPSTPSLHSLRSGCSARGLSRSVAPAPSHSGRALGVEEPATPSVHSVGGRFAPSCTSTAPRKSDLSVPVSKSKRCRDLSCKHSQDSEGTSAKRPKLSQQRFHAVCSDSASASSKAR